MSKTKKTEVPHYELLYILSNKFTEEETKPLIEKVNKIIENNDGQITYAEEWGKKRLAYPIRTLGYGYYILTEFNAPGKSMEKINDTLRLTSEIVRFMIVNKPFKTQEEILQEKTKKEKRKEEEKKAEAEKEIKIEEKKKKVDIDLQDLNDKLDKILDTKDLL